MIFLLLAVTVLTNTLQVATAVCDGKIGMTFAVTGVATQIHGGTLSLNDDSGSVYLLFNTNNIKSAALTGGNLTLTHGIITKDYKGSCVAKLTNLVVVARTNPTDPIRISPSELLLNKHPGRRIIITGIICECFEDEIDEKYLYMTIKCGTGKVFVTLDNTPANKLLTHKLQDCLVEIIGDCKPFCTPGSRQIIGPLLACDPSNISVITPPPNDPYDVPPLVRTVGMTPTSLAAMEKRRLQGTVWAVRHNKDTLLKDDSGDPHLIRFRGPPPETGMRIETVGYPETDLYHLNLGDAIWKEIAGPAMPQETPQGIRLDSIIKPQNGKFIITPNYHGKAIRLCGTIVDLPSPLLGNGQFTLKSDGVTIRVDVSTCDDLISHLAIGYGVAVSGICLIETETWRPYSNFPHTTGITLVIRDKRDICITDRPPWLTPAKLLIAVASLLCIVIVLLVWNRWLNRLVNRRSQALVKEQLALAKAELKIGERTRLAIELHDSLSQNLAAVACQVSATKSAVTINAEETMSNLNTVERMLLSCRSELRRCLWDLRNDALDEQNMTEVIRKVLAPVIGKASLQIRFNVSRSRLDDSTLHTVICIIRELASNAVTHGQATRLTVAGDLDGETLAFSVNENGKGFNPGTCDGPAEGHFGLAGIRERIERLRGTFTLKSHPGKGSYTKITFRLPSNDVEG